ncbi:hypothetical protein HYH03_002829 [Edaphochlamys debaryana]|uniref:Uncharacterized protein n=1 Tax=Edaphochlamys debaryana TaxID=47281 RepID=A0A835YIJ0_9CHLO|nr:hypothetical protein HYH03_002829 [Edaphochlamys debaryana]|eukprot:KAG2499250.1 hypothetical protein HYH03_002829 [Edaphochlamys debaryana]
MLPKGWARRWPRIDAVGELVDTLLFFKDRDAHKVALKRDATRMFGDLPPDHPFFAGPHGQYFSPSGTRPAAKIAGHDARKCAACSKPNTIACSLKACTRTAPVPMLTLLGPLDTPAAARPPEGTMRRADLTWVAIGILGTIGFAFVASFAFVAAPSGYRSACNGGNRCTRELALAVPQPELQPSQEQLEAVLGSGGKYRQYQDRVEGDAVSALGLSFTSQLAHFQLSHGITGSVGEVGTSSGRYFLALAAAALPEEAKVAVDVFESQDTGAEGGGTYVDSKRFREHATSLGVHNLTLLFQAGAGRGRMGGGGPGRGRGATCLEHDSHTVSVDVFVRRRLPAFRVFSVDGGHSFESTLRDLRLAACSIRRGGVVVLDDWSMDWAGVVDASLLFLHGGTDLVPFLASCGKLYLTTKEYHPLYMSWVTSLGCFHCTATIKGMSPSRYQLAGASMCIDTQSDCNRWCFE